MKGRFNPERKCFLLVDENQQERADFRHALKRGKISCQITECKKTEEVIDLLGNIRSFHLIVIDSALSGMSCLELYSKMQCEGDPPPSVMLARSGSEPLAVQALQAGFADYLIKDPAKSYLQLLPVVISNVLRRQDEKLARQRLEEAMAASRERLALTLESMTDAYFSLDEQWRVMEVNAAAARDLFARPAAELIGRVFWELCPRARSTESYQRFRFALETGKSVHFVERSACPEKWWEARAHRFGERLEVYLHEVTERQRFEEELRLANQQLELRMADRTRLLTEAIYALQTEMNDRESAEQRLRDSKEKYSRLVQNSLTGIFIEQEGRIVFANNKLAEIYGYRPEEITGIDVLDLIHPKDRGLVAEITQKRLKGLKVPAEYDARGITKTGEMIWVQRRNALIEHQGRPAILANHIDITRTKQAFDRLEKSRQKLKLLSNRLLSVLEDERKRIARELHDSIGSSLSSIKYGLEYLLQLLEPASDAAGSTGTLINVAQDAIQEARRLMSDLRPAMIDDLGLQSTIAWFCRRFQSIYPHIVVTHRLEVQEKQIPEHLKIVMFRIMQEAMQNIAKYSGTESATVSVGIRDGALELTIEDRGKGFDLESALSMDDPGEGLGLTSMRERTEFSGGSFLIHSAVGKGTMVQARWPLPPPDQEPSRETFA